MGNINTNIRELNYPDEIAEKLCKLANVDEKQICTDCSNALYFLRSIAENEYNEDWYIKLYAVLSKITDMNF